MEIGVIPPAGYRGKKSSSGRFFANKPDFFFSSDVIHSVPKGSIFTLNQISVGCGIHSLTGSQKTLQIFSRLKDSCTAAIVRIIETSQAELAQVVCFLYL